MSKEAQGASKVGKASARASTSIQLTPSVSGVGDKCKICDKIVGTENDGIACEICEKWFHIKCEGMSGVEYEFLMAHKSLHWYCDDCNKSVATTIKLFNSLKQKVDCMEEKLNKICDGILPELMTKSIEGKIKNVADLFDSKVKQIQNEIQVIKDLATAADTKLETAIEAKLVDSVGSIKKDLEPSWATIVSKEVTNQFQRVSKDVSSVQAVLEDTRKQANQEREKETRAHNIIIKFYRVPEAYSREDRIKEDSTFCLEL